MPERAAACRRPFPVGRLDLATPAPLRARRPSAALHPSAIAARGHSLAAFTVAPRRPGPAAAGPIQAAKAKQVEISSSHGRFARRWQAAFGSRKNLATLKLRHTGTKKQRRRVLYLNAESLGMGFKSFTSPHETVKTASGTLKRRKHSEPQLLLSLLNRKVRHGKRIINLSKYEPEWAFSTNEACGSSGEGCGGEVVPSLAPGKTPFYFQNPYQGSGESGGFGKSYNKFYQDKEDSDSESESESDIEDVLMIKPEEMRGVDFGKSDAVPVTDMNKFLARGKHTAKKKGKSTRRWERYEGRTSWGSS